MFNFRAEGKTSVLPSRPEKEENTKLDLTCFQNDKNIEIREIVIFFN